MSEIDKLRMLLPHWIEHNEEHAAEFERWAEMAAAAGHADAAGSIRTAAKEMAGANITLQQALDELGGPLSPGAHGHTH